MESWGHLITFSTFKVFYNFNEQTKTFARLTPRDTEQPRLPDRTKLTGIAIDHHFIKGTDQKIYPYFKDYEIGQKWDKKIRDVMLESLLTMTTGYACDDHEIPNFQCEKAMYKTDDWVEYALNLPMAYKPGEHWAYNSSSLILVSEMISKTSKMTISDVP